MSRRLRQARGVAFGLLAGIWAALLAPAAGASTLLVGDAPAAAIHAYDTATGVQLADFVTSGSGGLNWTDGMSLGPDVNGDGYRELYVSSFAANTLLRYDGRTGAPFPILGQSGAFFASVGAPRGVTMDPSGRIYVASGSTQEVLRFDASSAVALPSASHSGAVFVASADAGGALNGMIGLTFGPGGDLFLASRNSNNVVRFDGATAAYEGVFFSAGLNTPRIMIFDGTSFYVANRDDPGSYTSSNVTKYDASGNLVATSTVFPAGQTAYGLALDGGYLYVSSDFSKLVRRYQASDLAFVDSFIPQTSGAFADLAILSAGAPVPEPGALALAGAAVAAVAGARRRRA